MTQKTPTPQPLPINILTTAGAILSLLGGIVTFAFFVAPLRTLPNSVDKLQGDLVLVKTSIAVQAETMKKLAEVSMDAKQIRRDVDDHTGRIINLERHVAREEGHR